MATKFKPRANTTRRSLPDKIICWSAHLTDQTVTAAPPYRRNHTARGLQKKGPRLFAGGRGQNLEQDRYMHPNTTLCQVISLVKSQNNLHPRRRKRLIHFLLDKGVSHEASDSIAIGGTAISIAGIESIDQMPITFVDMKAYDLDFLKPVDATQEQVDAWKDERRRNNAAERQSKSRAKRRKAYLKELSAKRDAEAERTAAADADGRHALQEFDQLSDRDRAVSLAVCGRPGITTPEIIAKVRTLSAFKPRVCSPFPSEQASVKNMRDAVRRSLKRLEAGRWLDLADAGFWRCPMTKAAPTAKARRMMEQRRTVARHTMPQCDGTAEIIEEIQMTPVTLSKKGDKLKTKNVTPCREAA